MTLRFSIYTPEPLKGHLAVSKWFFEKDVEAFISRGFSTVLGVHPGLKIEGFCDSKEVKRLNKLCREFLEEFKIDSCHLWVYKPGKVIKNEIKA